MRCFFMSISFLGINESIVTFKTQGNISKGDLVSVASDGTVKKADDGASFIGICTSSNATLTAVQIAGFATIPVTNTTQLTYGRQSFVSSDKATLKLSTASDKNPIPLQVISIDKTNACVGVFL